MLGGCATERLGELVRATAVGVHTIRRTTSAALRRSPYSTGGVAIERAHGPSFASILAFPAAGVQI